MRILLIGAYLSYGSCILGIIKALGDLGHSVQVWDNRAFRLKPQKGYDAVIAWTNDPVHRFFGFDAPTVLYYQDDSGFWEKHDKNKTLDALAPHYDHVYTVNKHEGWEKAWMPVGAEEDVFRPVFGPQKQLAAAFIGTNRDPKRLELLRVVSDRLRSKGLGLEVFGNGWEGSRLSWAGRPVYHVEFSLVCSMARVVLQQHYGAAPSTKVHEVASTGAAFVCDDKDAVKECYPCIPTYSTAEEAADLCEFYCQEENVLAGKLLGNRLRELSAQFTYRHQISRILNDLKL